MHATAAAWAAATALLVLLLASTSHALTFDILPGTTKCVTEDIQQGVLVLGEYEVVFPAERAVTATVSSPRGEIIFTREASSKGSFGFTAKDSGTYKACFWSSAGTLSFLLLLFKCGIALLRMSKSVLKSCPTADRGSKLSVKLQWKTGVEAKDWTAIAKKENLKGIELEMRQLEETVASIYEEQLYLKDREKELRDISENLNGRVAWFSVLTLFICVGLALLQLYYLRSFFERKKLL
eukprot:jgi/Chlat1/3777/Chrsp259S03914